MITDSELKTYAIKTLAGLLGALDSLHEPRNTAWSPDHDQDQAHWQRRAQWLTDGLFPFKNPGSDPAERKHYARSMSELERSKLIKQGPREMRGLTDEGLSMTRHICQRLQLEEVLPGLDFMLGLIGTGHDWTDDISSGWFSEASLAGYAPWPRGTVGKPRLPDSALWVCDALIPLLIAGYVVFDFRPEFELPLYRLTAEGMKIAKSRKKSGGADPSGWLKLADRKQPEPPPVYSQAWQAMGSFLQTAPPLKSNWVTHHLSINIFPRGKIATGRHYGLNKTQRKV